MADMTAYLSLLGNDFDLNYVTLRTGISPNRTILRTEPAPCSTEWCVHTDTITSFEIQDVLDSLMALVICDVDVLSELARACNAKWKIHFDIRIRNKEAPIIFFPAGFLLFCNRLNAELDLDMQVVDQ